MAVPFFKEMKIGSYLVKQKLMGKKRYPLVLMLEPLFRCNLACAGCGKIDYPDPILNKRLSVQECLEAVRDASDMRFSYTKALYDYYVRDFKHADAQLAAVGSV